MGEWGWVSPLLAIWINVVFKVGSQRIESLGQLSFGDIDQPLKSLEPYADILFYCLCMVEEKIFPIA